MPGVRKSQTAPLTRAAANVAQAVVLLSTASAGIGLLGRWHFVPDLASHFRVHVVAALLLASAFLWILDRRRWSAASLAVGVLLAASLLPLLWPRAAGGQGSYRLMTVNVLTSNPHPELVVDYVLRRDPDIVVLQETNSSWIETLDTTLDDWPYRKSVPRSDNFGIAIYSKLPWSDCTVVEYPTEVPTPSLSAIVELPSGGRVRIIAVHPVPPVSRAYWGSRNALFASLAADVKAGMPDRTIVAGDFNCSPWSYWFGRLCRESGLRDSSLGQGIRATWAPIRISVFGLPIDHVLVGEDVRVSHRAVGPYVGSDHRPIVVDFD